MGTIIRDAINSDKFSVLSFCKDTFSWGDYIQDVWDYWLSKAIYLLLKNNIQLAYVMHFSLKIKYGLKESELTQIFVDKVLLQI